MKTRIIVALLLGILIFCSAAFGRNETRHPDGVVAYCFDGDTIKLKDRRVVRLAGIDAPETAHQESPAQYYSRQSRQTLEELVRGKAVSLQFPGEGIRDRHGRIVANVILPDGRSVNELMISSGAAFFYPHQDLDKDFQANLCDLQRNAILERRGMWEYLLNLPLAEQHYIGNKNSLRFFPANCEKIQNMKPRNKENFGNLMDAFLAGYAPARICIFWPNEESGAH